MDPITHGFTGAAIRNLGFTRPHVLAVLVVSSMFPDMDYITRLWGTDVLLRYHRGITHGIAAAVVMPALIAVLAGGIKRDALHYYLLSFGAYMLHILMDLTTQYGTRILAPLDWGFYSLGQVFIIDQYLSFGLALSVFLAISIPKRARLYTAMILLALIAYYGIRVEVKGRAMDYARSMLGKSVVQGINPLPTGMFRWWFVAKTPEGTMKTGIVDLFTKQVYLHKAYPPEPENAFVEGSRHFRLVRDFLEFAKHPYVSMETREGRVIVRWTELSYSYLPEEHFTATVVMDEKTGKVIEKRFVF